MTVGELISQLEGYDEDAEVRLMTQESWPFENSVRGVVARDEFSGKCETCGYDIGTNADDCDECADAATPNTSDEPNTVFIVEGRQLCYGNKAAWENL